MTITRNFTLRPATEGDTSDIARMVRALASFENLGHEAVATVEDFHRQLFGPTPRAEAMIARSEGTAVGFALWFYNFSTFAGRPGLYVEDIFVEPSHRGLGIGRAMFRTLALRALQNGCARMEWSVLDWNEKAIAFYRGMGAQPMNEWTVQRLSGAALARLAEEP